MIVFSFPITNKWRRSNVIFYCVLSVIANRWYFFSSLLFWFYTFCRKASTGKTVKKCWHVKFGYFPFLLIVLEKNKTEENRNCWSWESRVIEPPSMKCGNQENKLPPCFFHPPLNDGVKINGHAVTLFYCSGKNKAHKLRLLCIWWSTILLFFWNV